MLYGKYFSLCTLSCLLFLKSTTVYGFIDPLTGASVLGAFVSGYFINKSNFYFYDRCPNTFDIKGKANLNITFWFFLQLKINNYFTDFNFFLFFIFYVS